MKYLSSITHLLLVLLLPATVTAHDFEVDGIYYNILNDNEVEVTYKGQYINSYLNEYSGSITIPLNVTYNHTTYSITTIGESAFSGCSSLTSVTIPNSVTYISDIAFSYCSGLTSIIVESGNPKYDSRNSCNAIIETSSNILIVGCMNTVIPGSVTSIGFYAFGGSRGLTSVYIPNSVTTICEGAFFDCRGLTSVTFPNSVTSIGFYAFYDCSGLTSVYIPNSVTHIDGNAFQGCSGLTSVTIGNSALTIDEFAFSCCCSLTSVNIPNSVTCIGYGAFESCSSLKDVYSYIVDPSAIVIDEDVFYLYSANYSERTLHVPEGSLAAYQADVRWSDFFGTIVEGGKPGDVDADGRVSIADVTELIDRILRGEVSVSDYPAADVNGNGIINIADVVELIDQLLN